MKLLPVVLLLITSLTAQAQDSLKVLFLGNSYIYTNSLPSVLSAMAASAGDNINYGANTIGGYTLQNHYNDSISKVLIAQGTWDFVVLQEQSQLPAFPITQVEEDVYPYAKKLDSLVRLSNTCTETVFYTTWGRKNGDANNCGFYPPICTYNGMDSLLQLRYKTMAANNDAIIAPAAQLWHYLRDNFPAIELYNPDESHPSAAGTYAAACAFYTVLFRKDPTLITYYGNIDSTDAATIRTAAKQVVFNQLTSWFIGKYDPSANFTYMGIGHCDVQFTSTSQNANNYLWIFGDNSPNSNEENPLHLYPNTAEIYQTSLIVSSCGRSDTLTIPVVTCLSGIDEHTNAQVKTYPNPFIDKIAISTELTGKPGNWQLYNAQGQLIQTGTLKNSLIIDRLENLPNGLYLLKLQVGDKTAVKRVVKN